MPAIRYARRPPPPPLRAGSFWRPVSRPHRQFDQSQIARHRMEVAVICEAGACGSQRTKSRSANRWSYGWCSRRRNARNLRAAAIAIASPAIGTIAKRRSRASTSRASRSLSKPCSTSQSIRSPTMISSWPKTARKRRTWGAFRPLKKSIQTLLSTTIARSLALCGFGQGCRASGICRKRRRRPAVAAA